MEAENKFTIYFDGGTLKEGKGYGSWQVTWNGFSKRVERELYQKEHPFDRDITNNIAEYSALLGALRWLKSVQDKFACAVEIWGDSQLVLKQVSGEYKVRKHHLVKYRDECLNLLKDFESFTANWHDRYNNVRRFGH